MKQTNKKIQKAAPKSNDKHVVKHEHEKHAKGTKMNKYLPHIIALAAIFLFNVFYFFPSFQGKTLYQGDIVSHKAMAKEVADYKDKTGKVALWTNSMFSGMPAYQISAPQEKNLLQYVLSFLKMGFKSEIAYFILGMICFYIMMILLGFNPWMSLISSFAFTYLTLNILLLEAGHNTKLSAIMLTPLVFGGALLLLRKKYILGGLMFTISMGMELLSNHIQMTYYFGLVLVILVVIEFIRKLRNSEFVPVGIITAIFAIGIILAVATSASKLWTTYEYSKETMRGTPILKSDKKAGNDSDSGLKWDYAMQYSNGGLDLLSGFIPGIAGGANNEKVSKDSDFARKYRELAGQLPPQVMAPLYWGVLPTGGPTYLGALILFLFIFGMFTVKSNYKWWALISVLLLFMLSMGKNFEFFNRLFYDYFPLYSKFRTPNSIMALVGIPVVFFAFYTLRELINEKINEKILLRNLYITLAFTGGTALFFLVLGTSFFDFSSMNDENYKQYGIVDALIATRKSLMISDSFRTLAIVLVGAGMIWLFVKNKISKNILFAGVSIVIFLDILIVDLRYVSHSTFVPDKNVTQTYEQREVDRQILNDKSLSYRVFDTSVDPFNSSLPAYWHKDIGGYHPAKLQRYQDVIEKYISKGDVKTLSMLNTKYIIQKNDKGEFVSQNPVPMGNAWLVDSIKMVSDANQEIDQIKSTDVRKTAIVNKEFEDYVKSYDPDTSGEVKMTLCTPDKLEYQSTGTGNGFIVFSEIWYGEKGAWKAYIDDKESKFIRVNYLLRGMKIPQGDHKIRFEFKPQSYYMGENISLISSLLLILLSIGYLAYHYYTNKKLKDQNVADYSH